METLNPDHAEKQELLVISKVDVLPAGEGEKLAKALGNAIGKEVITLSVIDDDLLKSFSDSLAKELKAGR